MTDLTLAKLTAENNKLECEIAMLMGEQASADDEIFELEARIDKLKDELADAFFLSADDTPQRIFTTLRRDLAGWPTSDWRALERLIHDHQQQGR
jgi:hypothetical protein